MAADGRAQALAQRTGVRQLDADLAITALRQVVMRPEPTAVVADVEPEPFLRTFTAARPSALLSELPGYDEILLAGAAATDTASGAPLRRELAGLAPAQRRATVLKLVRHHAADVLGHGSGDAIGADRPFRDLGFDSLGAVELRNQLNAATGLALTATLIFDHPTPESLAEHVLRELLGEAGDSTDIDDTEIGQAGLRALLSSVSIAQLREIGVLDQLLALAGRTSPDDTAPTGDFAESIDAMGIDDLVQAALHGTHAQD
jgi:KS-AT-KR-ACP domain-containing polyene macrolide polyketide synthase/pimaricinolide synthase PimS2/candicidin polyketide synthase FscD